MPGEPLRTAREVADLFGVTFRTLHNWEHRGVLRPVRINGRRYFEARAIDALVRGAGDGAGQADPETPSDQ